MKEERIRELAIALYGVLLTGKRTDNEKIKFIERTIRTAVNEALEEAAAIAQDMDALDGIAPCIRALKVKEKK